MIKALVGSKLKRYVFCNKCEIFSSKRIAFFFCMLENAYKYLKLLILGSFVDIFG